MYHYGNKSENTSTLENQQMTTNTKQMKLELPFWD